MDVFIPRSLYHYGLVEHFSEAKTVADTCYQMVLD